MSLYKNKYRIESARCPNWNYNAVGFYYITICTKNRIDLFGKIVDGKMILNDYGKILDKCWYDLTNHYDNLILDEFIIMPDHIHGILIISIESPKHGLFEFVRALKTFSSRRINAIRNTRGATVWQPKFHDHIIRDDISLYRIRKYIQNNPQNW